MKGSITARIQCTVEIEVGTWSGGKSVDVDALTNQIRREGQQKLASIMNKAGGHIVGAPKVLMILAKEQVTQ